MPGAPCPSSPARRPNVHGVTPLPQRGARPVFPGCHGVRYGAWPLWLAPVLVAHRHAGSRSTGSGAGTPLFITPTAFTTGCAGSCTANSLDHSARSKLGPDHPVDHSANSAPARVCAARFRPIAPSHAYVKWSHPAVQTQKGRQQVRPKTPSFCLPNPVDRVIGQRLTTSVSRA